MSSYYQESRNDTKESDEEGQHTGYKHVFIIAIYRHIIIDYIILTLNYHCFILHNNNSREEYINPELSMFYSLFLTLYTYHSLIASKKMSSSSFYQQCVEERKLI